MRFAESRLQQSCVRWFRYAHRPLSRLLFAVPNGGARDRVTGAILKAEGVMPGVADLLLLVPNKTQHGLCIEMKTKTGRQQDTQKAWQADVEAQGYAYIVVRDFDSFVKAVEKYLAE